MKYRHKYSVLASGLLLTLMVTASNAATTNITCNGVGDGGLQAAITAAASGDIINIQGTCIGGFLINTPITLTMQQDPTPGALPAILDGGGTNMVVEMRNAVVNVTYNGLTIRNGKRNSRPGAMIVQGTATINNCIITGNRGNDDYPSAIEMNGNASLLTINNSIVTGNTLGREVIEGDNMTINNSKITGNSAIESVIDGNRFFLYNSTVSGNTVEDGVVIDSNNSTEIINSTLTGNSAERTLSTRGGSISIVNSTISGNSAKGITLNCGVGCGSYIFLTGNIIAGNSGVDITVSNNPLMSGGFNLFGTVSGVFGGALVTVAGDILPIPALANLGPLQDNGGPTFTMMPLSTPTPSLAIGANSAANCLFLSAKDQRGAPRPGIGKTACDIGAYETGSPQLTLTLPSNGILDFGIVNAATDMMVEVQNTGNAPVPSQNLAISGANASKFALPGTPDVSPISIGLSRDYTVRYTPTTNTVDTDSFGISAADTNTVNVTLTGTGNGFTPPPIQAIADLIVYVKQQITLGNLYGVGPGKSAKGRLGAFNNMLFAVSDLIVQNKIAEACTQLNDALKKVDGIAPPPDFVAGTAAPSVAQEISDISTSLNCN